MEVVLIPGLGGDRRLFKNLQFKNCNYTVLEFTEPLKNESLTAYCKRIVHEISGNKEIVLIGVSLGGIIAQELSKLIDVKKIILISSIKSSNGKPWYYLIAKIFPFYRVIPDSLFKWLCAILSPLFGTKTKEDRLLYQQMLRSSTANFLKWGVKAVLNWEQQDTIPNTVLIHGNKDHIFPVRFVKPDHLIEGGQHFMIVQKPAEIMEIVNKILLQT
ncbi:MAG: alpha/beta hydrolase [Chitinophagales bacterium]|nr:alpha/beta hydrolase [Chitinophagales bacterium]